METTVQGYTGLTYSTGMEFRERIYPTLGVTFALLALVLATSFAIWAALETIIAIAFALVASLLASIWWVGAIHKIELDGDLLRVNDARIKVGHLANLQLLQGEEWRRRLGADFDPALFHAHRFWMRSGVEVSLEDERDPHTGWLIGSKEGERLVKALDQAIASNASERGSVRGSER